MAPRAMSRPRSTPRALTCRPRFAATRRTGNPIRQTSPSWCSNLNSDTLSPGQLYDLAATILQQKLSQLPGVGDVNVGGSSLPAVRVELNPTALFKYGVGMEDVRAALSAANANSPKGAIEDDGHHWQIYSNDQAHSAALYRPLVIAYLQ